MSTSSWYLLQFKPNSHKIAERNLARQGFETFLPLQKTMRRVRGRMSEGQTPLFPGYMFVRLDPQDGSWRSVNSTFGVSRLVTLQNRPQALPAALVNGLRARCGTDGILLPPTELQPGDQVRLQTGPFAEFVATVDRIAADQRVWLLLDFMGKATRVQADRTQIAAA
jgi:transcriptional antiterminator RfaH